MKVNHVRPDGLAAPNGYSQVVEFSGKLVAVSGQVAFDADGQIVGRDDPEAQVRQVFANLRVALEAAGAGLENVVKLTVYLTDIGDLAVVRRVRGELFGAESAPASTLVAVSSLVDPALRVEIEALAVI